MGDKITTALSPSDLIVGPNRYKIKRLAMMNLKTKFNPLFQEFLLQLQEAIICREIVVFCGAGISRNSGLPIVTELVPYTLEKMAANSIPCWGIGIGLTDIFMYGIYILSYNGGI